MGALGGVGRELGALEGDREGDWEHWEGGWGPLGGLGGDWRRTGGVTGRIGRGIESAGRVRGELGDNWERWEGNWGALGGDTGAMLSPSPVSPGDSLGVSPCLSTPE